MHGALTHPDYASLVGPLCVNAKRAKTNLITWRQPRLLAGTSLTTAYHEK
jgi:hypothetical protein